MDFTTLALRLLLAHALGDFVLQPSAWIADRRAKHARSIWVYVHGALHGLLAWVALGAVARWPEALVIAGTHVVVDVVKSYRDGHGRSARWFVVDQTLHVAVLAFVAARVAGVDLAAVARHAAFDPRCLAVASAVLLVTRPAAVLVATITSRWDGELGARKDNLNGAGTWIGVLERLLIVLFVLIDVFEAVGFLLAAKSIFRFGDLTNPGERKRTEYVLIGTLLSFAIAIGVGLLARAIVRAHAS